MRARWFPMLALVLAGACGDDGGGAITPTPMPDAAPAPIQLTEWVTSMTDVTRDDALPDSVDDKVGVVVDTDDPAAFDSFLVEP